MGSLCLDNTTVYVLHQKNAISPISWLKLLYQKSLPLALAQHNFHDNWKHPSYFFQRSWETQKETRVEEKTSLMAMLGAPYTHRFQTRTGSFPLNSFSILSLYWNANSKHETSWSFEQQLIKTSQIHGCCFTPAAAHTMPLRKSIL